MATRPMDGLMNDTLLVGASAAPFAFETPRLQSKAEFLRQHREISGYLLNKMLAYRQVETVPIGTTERIVVGSYERHIARHLVGER
jgi:hypothetical protein